MDLREIVQNIVSELSTAPSFLYGRKSEINYSADNVAQTFVALIEPETGAFQRSSIGTLRDAYDTFIQFVGQIDPGEHADYRHPMIQQQMSIAKEFIRALDRSDYFLDLNANIPFVIIVDNYDLNVAGVEINLARLASLQPLDC